jgi:ribosome-interacting GTPase 1
MPINAGYEYGNAEKAFHEAKTIEEKISTLQEMISVAPGHKGAETLRGELRLRLKKLKEKQEKSKSVGKSSKKGIKKEGFQIVLFGLPNTGKSSILAKLTNAKPLVSESAFTTTFPTIGTFFFQGIKAQMVDTPSIGSEYFDIGLVNTADLILLVINSLQELEKISPLLSRSYGKQLIVINKSDLLTSDELRKLEATIKSKKLSAVLISCYNNYNFEKFKETIIKKMDVIRVYTKEPGKSPSKDPMILRTYSTVKDAAESIRKGFFSTVRETRITGPSSKFPNQKVGLSHQLKDLDIIEFHAR